MTCGLESEQALCLDGSRFMYFIRPGDPQKWLVFFQGGGWCWNVTDCAARAKTSLGSSSSWPSTYPAQLSGQRALSLFALSS